MDASLVSEALVVWTGWGSAARPVRDEALLVDRFGSEEAADLFPTIRELEDEFYGSEARFTEPSLKAMGDAAALEFRAAHPELSEDAIQALAWCYTYDYK